MPHVFLAIVLMTYRAVRITIITVAQLLNLVRARLSDLFDLLYHLNYSFQFGLKGEYKRKGEGRIKTHPPGPVPKTKFPSGIVEYIKRIGLESIYQPNPHLLVEGEVGYNRIDNYENTEKKDQDNFFFSIRLNYNFWKEREF